MSSAPQKLQFGIRPLGYLLFGLANLLLIMLILDNLLRVRLGFDWFNIFFVLPLVSGLAFFGFWASFKEMQSPDNTPKKPLGRIATACFVMLYLAIPTAGAISVAAEVATCRTLQKIGKEATAKAEDLSLFQQPVNRPTRTIPVQDPTGAEHLRMEVSFTASNTAVSRSITPYLPDREVIAKVYNQAQNGTLKVRYMPDDPKTFVIAGTPCRESIFAAFVPR